MSTLVRDETGEFQEIEMGLFNNLIDKPNTADLPDVCVEKITEATLEVLKWSTQWHGYVCVSVAPGDENGNVTYRNQTGMVVRWWEPDLMRPEYLVIDKFITTNFTQIVDQNGKDDMAFYWPLPPENIGQEAAYAAYVKGKVEVEFPEAEIRVGSDGRQLTISISGC
jgi:hypothetical protein